MSEFEKTMAAYRQYMCAAMTSGWHGKVADKIVREALDLEHEFENEQRGRVNEIHARLTEIKSKRNLAA